MECIETFPIQILCLRPGILAAVIITSAVEYKTTNRKPAAEKHFPVRQSQDISPFSTLFLFYYFDLFERKRKRRRHSPHPSLFWRKIGEGGGIVVCPPSLVCSVAFTIQ